MSLCAAHNTNNRNTSNLTQNHTVFWITVNLLHHIWTDMNALKGEANNNIVGPWQS